jgi:hypothetical protein
MAIPAQQCADGEAGHPAQVTRPRETGIRPVAARSRVDFPAPFGPITTVGAPGPIHAGIAFRGFRYGLPSCSPPARIGLGCPSPRGLLQPGFQRPPMELEICSLFLPSRKDRLITRSGS